MSPCRFVDVSCDTSNPANPFPIYKDGTTLFKPVLRIRQPEVMSAPTCSLYCLRAWSAPSRPRSVAVL